jgi:hypothetical protein
MTREHHHDQARAGGSTPAARTAAFLAAGVGLLLLGGWLNLRPTLQERAVKAGDARTEMLFPELDDADKAASLEVVSFDDETATLRSFKVVRSDGVWVLPSHDNYPADAREQMAAAATELIDRPVLEVVTDSPGDHQAMGVIEPDPRKVKVGETGVGQLVEIRDAAGNKLARLVIGKEDKRRGGAGPSAGRTLRFVRRAGQDRVYRVELDTSKFSTKFDDWIEKDLLKLQPWDVKRVVLDDYAIQPVEADGQIRLALDRKARVELGYDDKDASWSLVGLESFGPDGKPREERLAADEELASAKLNALRDAVGNLKIVDVARKPAGLGAELKAEGTLTDESRSALKQRGFLAMASGDILSANGETIIGLKDGVEYVLRFGQATMADAGEQKDDEEAAAGDAGKDAGDTLGRYLFVMARFDESLLEKPKLDPVPEVPEAPPAAATGEKPPADGAGEDAAAKLQAADEAEAKAQAALEEKRRVERENRRRQDEYDDRVKAARKRVRELNSRFADWYYIVSGKEYARIHLGRADIVQKKPAEGKSE